MSKERKELYRLLISLLRHHSDLINKMKDYIQSYTRYIENCYDFEMKTGMSVNDAYIYLFYEKAKGLEKNEVSFSGTANVDWLKIGEVTK